jgi:DUF4097 and DUF4098 domain-containing protein YvlB
MKRALIALIAVAALSGASPTGRQIDEKRPADKTGTVQIDNLAGAVKVTGWERAEVAVKGTLGRGVERLDFEGSGGTTSVRVVVPRHAHNVEGAAIEVWVPAGSRVEVNTVSARIDIGGVEGALRAESVSGEVRVTGASTDIEVETVSGSIDVDSAKERMRAKSVSGNVEIRDARGEIEVGAVSGNVRVFGGKLRSGEVETTSGRIRLEAGLSPQAAIEIGTVTGGVEIGLPAAVSAEFEVTTFSGDIENDFGPRARRTSQYGPGKELSFSTGGGSARVRVNSFSGSVWLRKK